MGETAYGRLQVTLPNPGWNVFGWLGVGLSWIAHRWLPTWGEELCKAGLFVSVFGCASLCGVVLHEGDASGLVWGIAAIAGYHAARAFADTLKRVGAAERLASSGIHEIDQMDGYLFEARLAALFQLKGYQVERTPKSGDYGADLVLTGRSGKIVVQAKRWAQPVGNKAVQAVVASKYTYGAVAALVVTTSRFTKQAQKQARDCGVELWDRSRLVQELLASPLPLRAMDSKGLGAL